MVDQFPLKIIQNSTLVLHTQASGNYDPQMVGFTYINKKDCKEYIPKRTQKPN
jgi:hypothetical protein